MTNLDDLLSKWQDEELTQDEYEQLLKSLDDPDARSELAEAFVFDNGIRTACAEIHAEESAKEIRHTPRPASRRRHRAKRMRLLKNSGARMTAALVSGVAAAAAVLIVLVYPETPISEPQHHEAAPIRIARIDSIEGDVELSRLGSQVQVQARPGDLVWSGDRISTRSSRVKIVFESGTVALLNSNTVLSVNLSDGVGVIDLAAGEVYVAIDGRDSGFAVITPHGKTVDLGTRFAVTADATQTTVVVAEGSVVSSTDNGSATLDEGQEVSLTSKSVAPGEVKEARDLELRLAWTRTFDPKPELVVVEPKPEAAPAPVDPPVVDAKPAPAVPIVPDEVEAPPPVKPPPKPAPPEVVSFSLINAKTGNPIGTIPNKATIHRLKLPGRKIIIEAHTAPKTVGHVEFVLDNGQYRQVEKVVPYTLAGDNANGKFDSITLKPGWHTLTATPFVGKEGSLRKGKPLTIIFRVIN